MSRSLSASLTNTFLSSRRLRRLMKPALPKTAMLTLDHGFRLYVDAADMTGPSYYVMNDGVEAFYHYEKLEKGEVLSGLKSDRPIFFDVGANIGLFSLFVSRLLPQVEIHAFEPHPVLSECLRRTARANSLDKLNVQSKALSDRRGEMKLWTHGKNSGGHSLDRKALGDEPALDGIEVEITTLDDYVREHGIPSLDVLKIDVQGHELGVLRGASKTLRTFHPKLVVEIDFHSLDGDDSVLNRFFAENAISYRTWREIGRDAWLPLAELPAYFRSSIQSGLGQANLVIQA